MSNLAPAIQKHWPSSLLHLVVTAGEVAQGLGYSLYLVGGAVRDLLLGRTNLDLDLVVEGDGLQVARQLAAKFQVKAIPHPRFGTATLFLNGQSLDFTTARREEYPHPGALPIVHPDTLQADLFRRDFTINALAMRVSPGPFGELIDSYGGQQDLVRGLIRVLHPNSFRDDATRIFRALRYEQRLGFCLEMSTEEWLRRDVAILDTISGDRIRREMELILGEERPELVLRRLEAVGALARLHPALRLDSKLAGHFAQARRSAPTPSSSLYLALLVYTLRAEELDQLQERLRFPAATRRLLHHTLNLKDSLHRLAQPGLSPSPSQVYHLLADYSPTAILANALGTDSAQAQENLQLYLNRLRYIKPSLRGQDLIQMGVPPGPRLGQILRRLMEARLDGQARSREEEAGLVSSWMEEGF